MPPKKQKPNTTGTTRSGTPFRGKTAAKANTSTATETRSKSRSKANGNSSTQTRRSVSRAKSASKQNEVAVEEQILKTMINSVSKILDKRKDKNFSSQLNQARSKIDEMKYANDEPTKKTIYNNTRKIILKTLYNKKGFKNAAEANPSLYPTIDSLNTYGANAWKKNLNKNPELFENVSTKENTLEVGDQEYSSTPLTKLEKQAFNNIIGKKYVVIEKQEKGKKILELEESTNKEAKNIFTYGDQKADSQNTRIKNVTAAERAKLNGEKFFELFREDKKQHFRNAVLKVFGTPTHTPIKDPNDFLHEIDSVKDMLTEKNKMNFHCTGERVSKTRSGFKQHAHSGSDRNIKCCSAFRNGQAGHNLNDGAQFTFIESKGIRCGWGFDGTKAPNTFPNPETPLS
jgi:hypothetical protein